MELTPLIIYGLIFVATLLLVDGLLRWMFRRRAKSADIRNRLQGLKARKDQQSAYNEFLSRRGISERESIFSLRWINRMYVQSGIEMPVTRRIAYVVLFILGGWVISILTLPFPLFGQVVFAILFGIGLTIGVVYMKRRRRISRFIAQLAPAIEIMVRSLNAGHPTSSSIALVSKEMNDPIGSEFGLLNDQLTFGLAMDAALQNMIERVGAEELKLLAVTLTVQRDTGGNLAEILLNLAKMIRDRLMMKAKIRAISAEGRFTAVIMAVFPFFLYWMIKTLVPDYFDTVIESGYAGTIVTVCLILMAFGIFILYRLVNFDF